MIGAGVFSVLGLAVGFSGSAVFLLAILSISILGEYVYRKL